MTEPRLLPIAPWLPERSRPGRCTLGLRHAAGVLVAVLLLIYMLVLGLMLLLLYIPRLILRLLLQPAASYFGYIVEHAYTLRICKLHVKLSRAIQKKWMRRPYHSRFSDIRTRLFPSDGGVCYVHAVPCLTDNFCYVLVYEGMGEDSAYNANRQGLPTTVVDPCDAAAVEEALEHIAERFYATYGGLRLEAVLCTHKHWDHAGGNEELAARASKANHSAPDSATESESQDVTAVQLLHFAERLKVFGGLEDDVPGCTHPVQHLDQIEVGNLSFQALGAPGHTQGSVMFRLPCKAESSAVDSDRLDALFTGDTLFSGGCGANFEGSDLDMEHCFGTILETCDPSYATWLFPGHEYTCMLMENVLLEACAKAAWHPPGHFLAVCSAFYTAAHRRALRDRLPTVPVLLDGERMINPRFNTLREHARVLLTATQRVGLQGAGADDPPLRVGSKVPTIHESQGPASGNEVAAGQNKPGRGLLVNAGAPPSQQLAVLYRADLDALRQELLGGLAGAEAAERLRQLERRPFEAALVSGEGDCFSDSGLRPAEEEAIKQEAAHGQLREPEMGEDYGEAQWNETSVKEALKVLAVPAHLAVGPKVPCKEEDLPISFRRLKAICDHMRIPSRSSEALLAVLQQPGENPSSEEEEPAHCCVAVFCCCQSARSIVARNVGDESPGADRLIPLRVAISRLTPPDVKHTEEESFFRRLCRCLPCSGSGSGGHDSADSAQESGGEGSEPTTEPEPPDPPIPQAVIRRRRFRAVERCFNKHQPEGCPLCTSSFRASEI
ncbi:PNKD [Symbiodinium natans]|uniref:PNKD protein n=1 Tax=Symbiodinium natans TaxID=878477 RepID=A0A812P1Z1_9DINO|nr:PNKD [Symbiodinium natans]